MFQAIRDNDKIYATVVTGINQDGHTVTPMTAPSGKQQVELMRRVYKKHRIDAYKVDYIEAHGKIAFITIFQRTWLPIIIDIHQSSIIRHHHNHRLFFFVVLL